MRVTGGYLVVFGSLREALGPPEPAAGRLEARGVCCPGNADGESVNLPTAPENRCFPTGWFSVFWTPRIALTIPALAAKLRGFTLSWSRYDYRGRPRRCGRKSPPRPVLDKGYRWCLLQSYGHVFAEQWRLEHWGRTSVAAALGGLAWTISTSWRSAQLRETTRAATVWTINACW